MSKNFVGKLSTRKSNMKKSSKNVENSLTVSQFKWGDDLPKNVRPNFLNFVGLLKFMNFSF